MVALSGAGKVRPKLIDHHTVKQWIGRRRVAESLPPQFYSFRLPRSVRRCTRRRNGVVGRWKSGLASVSSVVELGAFNAKVVGSNPTGSTLERSTRLLWTLRGSPPSDTRSFLVGQALEVGTSARVSETGAYRRARPLWIVQGFASLAQSVEQETLNLKVVGSNPTRSTGRKADRAGRSRVRISPRTVLRDAACSSVVECPAVMLWWWNWHTH